MKINQVVLDNIIIRMISDSKGFDCSFILGTSEFNELKSFFLKFFSDDILDDFNCKKIARNCYKYKNYVIKIGGFHYPDYILYDENIVKTYYKQNFEIVSAEGVLCLGIEIQDFLSSDGKASFIELYQVYKKLRDKKLIWFDIKPNNVIKKDGHIFIVDSDYIFRENVDNIVAMKSNLFDRFNELYLEEKSTKCDMEPI